MAKSYNVAELIPGRDAHFDGWRTPEAATRVYQVLRARNEAEGVAKAEPAFLEISGLPAVGSVHPVYSGIYVVGYDTQEDGNGTRWEISVLYGTDSDNESDGSEGRREVIEWWTFDGVDDVRDLTTDADTGAPVINAAGDPFASVPQVPVAQTQITLERRQTAQQTNVASLMAYNGTVNSSAITVGGISIAARTGRLTVRIKSEVSGIYAYRVTFTIRIRERQAKSGSSSSINVGWDEALIEQGFNYMDEPGAGGTKVRAMVPDGDAGEHAPSSVPVLLAADGTKLADAGAPVVKIVRAFRGADWDNSTLNIKD